MEEVYREERDHADTGSGTVPRSSIKDALTQSLDLAAYSRIGGYREVSLGGRFTVQQQVCVLLLGSSKSEALEVRSKSLGVRAQVHHQEQ